LGFSVDGGSEDLINFEIGKTFSLPSVLSTDENMYEISTDEYDTIIMAIKRYRMQLLQTKWAKKTYLKGLNTIDELIAYTKEPYEVEVENEESGESEIVIRYRNNLTTWEVLSWL
jgi:hypothetical protein